MISILSSTLTFPSLKQSLLSTTMAGPILDSPEYKSVFTAGHGGPGFRVTLGIWEAEVGVSKSQVQPV